MIKERLHGINSLSRAGESRHDHTLTALRDRWRLINEVRKIVSVNFFLNCGKQMDFCTVELLVVCRRNMGSAVYHGPVIIGAFGRLSQLDSYCWQGAGSHDTLHPLGVLSVALLYSVWDGGSTGIETDS